MKLSRFNLVVFTCIFAVTSLVAMKFVYLQQDLDHEIETNITLRDELYTARSDWAAERNRCITEER